MPAIVIEALRAEDAQHVRSVNEERRQNYFHNERTMEKCPQRRCEEIRPEALDEHEVWSHWNSHL
jgi:hypothetical protein